MVEGELTWAIRGEVTAREIEVTTIVAKGLVWSILFFQRHTNFTLRSSLLLRTTLVVPTLFLHFLRISCREACMSMYSLISREKLVAMTVRTKDKALFYKKNVEEVPQLILVPCNISSKSYLAPWGHANCSSHTPTILASLSTSTRFYPLRLRFSKKYWNMFLTIKTSPKFKTQP